MKYILTDVEGTTTSISFVHQVLFPYARENMCAYLELHQNDDLIINYLNQYQLNLQEFESKLIDWIDTDKKEKILKELQGLIWEEGYISGKIKGHVYPEVKSNFDKWVHNGIKLGVYSSGSIWAQKLIFKYSICGDLNQYISNNFDTTIGQKRELASYQNIIKKLNIPANEILFLSDIKEELDAAKLSGMHTIQLVRDNTLPDQGHKQVSSFDKIVF